MSPRSVGPWLPGSFLDRLSAPAVRELLKAGVTRSVGPRRRLLTEGDRDTHVELIHRGIVKVTTATGGHDQLLSLRLAGDIVGELAAVTDEERSASVTTCGEVEATVVSQKAFLAFLAHNPDAARQVSATVARRLKWANTRRTDFVAFPAAVRLARILADLATSCGQETRDGIMIGVELTQPELATLIGAADDTIHKALRTLKTVNLIKTGYRRITVVDITALAEWDPTPEVG